MYMLLLRDRTTQLAISLADAPHASASMAVQPSQIIVLVTSGHGGPMSHFHHPQSLHLVPRTTPIHLVLPMNILSRLSVPRLLKV